MFARQHANHLANGIFIIARAAFTGLASFSGVHGVTWIVTEVLEPSESCGVDALLRFARLRFFHGLLVVGVSSELDEAEFLSWPFLHFTRPFISRYPPPLMFYCNDIGSLRIRCDKRNTIPLGLFGLTST